MYDNSFVSFYGSTSYTILWTSKMISIFILWRSSAETRNWESLKICYVTFQFGDEEALTSSLNIFGIQIETRIMEQYVILLSLIYYLRNKWHWKFSLLILICVIYSAMLRDKVKDKSVETFSDFRSSFRLTIVVGHTKVTWGKCFNLCTWQKQQKVSNLP